MKRRTFLGGAAALAGTAVSRGLLAGGKRTPRARFGVLSDIHVTDDPQSWEIFEHALRYFDERRCDGVLQRLGKNVTRSAAGGGRREFLIDLFAKRECRIRLRESSRKDNEHEYEPS